eukprot:TRINITY_DN10882_c0_g1_i1.p2 TRINITY_DN10882_c0_g1~~TRINITY_DN10882_c0_g1_i1.p2  ORF type:complete len:86 (-),score=18.26 TRINITY_DN10882_c0_g1_i1:238-495(-)
MRKDSSEIRWCQAGSGVSLKTAKSEPCTSIVAVMSGCYAFPTQRFVLGTPRSLKKENNLQMSKMCFFDCISTTNFEPSNILTERT